MAEPIENYNISELVEIIRRRTAFRVSRSVPIERLRQLAIGANSEIPESSELVGTTGTRYSLQKFIVNNWAKINSQLPCTGQTRGQCTIHPCSDARHISCFMSVPPHLMV